MDNISLSVCRKINLSFTNHYGNVAQIAEALRFSADSHYRSIGLNYIDVPEIVGITGACENIDTLFKVSSRVGVPLFFSQTGQLSLEQALQHFHGAFTVIHSARDEETEDARHLRQFMLTEEEFDCTLEGMTRETYDEDKMYEALLTHIEKAIKAMINGVLSQHTEMLENVYHRNIDDLKEAVENPFNRIEYSEAIKLLNEHGYPELEFGDDLLSSHEAKIVELLTKPEKAELPVFIMKYPQEIKFFNMKPYTKNKKVVLSADLILPYSGEAVGSAVREHDFETLKSRLLTSTMFALHKARGGTIDDFEWYLNIMKGQKTNPHAGYGIGNERVMQYIFGTVDIRKVSVMSLLSKQTLDWEQKIQIPVDAEETMLNSETIK